MEVTVRIQTALGVVAVAAVTWALSASAAAQGADGLGTSAKVAIGKSLAAPPPPTRSDDAYDVEVGAMYSFLRDDGENGKAGFVFDVAKRLMASGKMAISGVGELAINHFDFGGGDTETYKAVAGGVRIGAQASPAARVFGQVLVGDQNAFGVNAFNIQPGAGFNFALGEMLDLRTQVDFPIAKFEGTWFKEFRFSVGVGVPLGG
jgi:hypothetical protein